MHYTWFLVGGAIIAEVTAAIMLRASDGFAKRLPAIAALAAFASAFYLGAVVLSQPTPVAGENASIEARGAMFGRSK